MNGDMISPKCASIRIYITCFTWMKLKTYFNHSWPMVSFQSSKNLSSYFFRAKFYPTETKTGSCICKGNRCRACLNVSETETFTSTVTHTSYKINQSFDCSDKCLIYLLRCKTRPTQSEGSTTYCFRYYWNSHKCNSR